jgi:hypothetical protein
VEYNSLLRFQSNQAYLNSTIHLLRCTPRNSISHQNLIKIASRQNSEEAVLPGLQFYRWKRPQNSTDLNSSRLDIAGVHP